MKVNLCGSIFDVLHVAFTWAMRHAVYAARTHQITPKESKTEVRNLVRLCAKIWREGLTGENVSLAYIVLGFIPVTSSEYTKCELLRNRLL